MTEEIVASGVCGLAEIFSTGKVSSVDATQTYLDRIEAHDGELNAFITVTADLALEQARDADKRLAQGAPLSSLDGIPIAIKDNIDIEGVVTTAGIEALRNNLAQEDAGSINALRAAGAVFLGKLNMHEAALGGITDNVAYGRCHNPHRRDWTPGGSSGGSGAAVAAGLCAAALGTDTLGSVRIPSSYCGTAGIKPTNGLVSSRGVTLLSWNLDHVGVLARSVADLGAVLNAMAEFDSQDAQARAAPKDFDLHLGNISSLDGLTLGRVAVDKIVEVESDIMEAYQKAIATLVALGARIKDVSMADYDHALMRKWGILIVEAEAALTHEKTLTDNPGGFTDELRERLEYGASQNSLRLVRAYDIIRQVKPLMRAWMDGVDALVLPTTPHTAFDFGNGSSLDQTAFTATSNYSGTPATAVPMGFAANGMPLSLQVIAREFEDALTLRIAAAYEQAAAHNMGPKKFDPSAS